MMLLMNKSTTLTTILATLSVSARDRELTDSAWAARAGLRKETLSRLRRRQSCDFRTLTALAEVVGSEIGALPGRPPDSSEDGHFPAKLDRDYEERLARLCASRNLDSTTWAANGPRFFMAGLATMLASAPGFDRRALLALAERLHPGASETEVFHAWLARTPVSPTRFFSLLDAEAPRAS